MRPDRRRRRGFILAAVLAVMLLIAGAMTVLTHSAIGLHKSRKHAAIQRTARLVAESGLAYARSHKDQWLTAAPTETLVPDVDAIIPSSMTGTLHITIEPTDGGRICRVRARVERLGLAETETRELVLD